MAIDITEAIAQSLGVLFAQPFVVSPGVGTPSTLVSGNIVVGWSDQRDRLVLPVISIDTPILGDSPGRTPTVIGQQRVDENGAASSDLNDEDFIWTVVFGNVDLACIVRVAAETPEERSEIDFAIDAVLMGDPINQGGLAAAPAADGVAPNADYFSQVFTYQRAGSARTSDSTTTAGRDEFESIREITGFGCLSLQFTAPSFKDLSLALKVTEMGRDFANVPSDSITIFDPSTP